MVYASVFESWARLVLRLTSTSSAGTAIAPVSHMSGAGCCSSRRVAAGARGVGDDVPSQPLSCAGTRSRVYRPPRSGESERGRAKWSEMSYAANFPRCRGGNPGRLFGRQRGERFASV
jgi:hypothetical protein